MAPPACHLGLQRRMRDRLPARVQVLGFSRWKRPIASVFLQGAALDFPRRPARLDAQRPVAVWGRRDIPVAPEQGLPVRTLRVEDGFIRSVGLGADLVRPLSWVVDDLGIYFDATAPSRLEHLLRHYPFDDALRTRAAALRQAILAAGLTKYNVGQGDWQRPAHARRLVLVPGKVETDASIRWGAADIRTNTDLLAAVRRAEPDAWHVVTLDRVVCCYPNMRALLKAASAKSRTAIAMTYPRDVWWTRAAVKVANFFQGLGKDPFRVFVHPVSEMEALLKAEGLKRVSTRRLLVWEMSLYQRS